MNPIIKGLFGIIAFSLLHLGAKAQQDCFDAINVCSGSYIENNSYVGVGSEQEVPNGSSCLGNGEANSVWYTFTANNSGNLLFQLNPLSPGDDYDFALYNLTNDSCSGISAGVNAPVSCNYSADAGPTGISAGGSGNNNGSSGSNQNAPLAVQAGETFVLLISNFTASQSGYELDFSGTASIVDNNAGVIESISLEGQCNPSRVRIFLTEAIACSSIAGDGSDFNVSGPSALTISSTNGISCSGGMSSQLWLTFADNIPTVGTYTVTIGVGSDGNTLEDGCNNEIAIGTSFQFVVENIGPQVTITNVNSSDCGLENGSATAVVTGGAAPYNFNWNSSPSQNTPTAINLEPRVYRVEVTDTNGCKTREFVTIDNNNPIDVSNTTATPVSCNGDANGTAQIIPAGGVAPFTFEWQTNPIQTGNNAINLPGGNVDVIVTDATGCDEEVTINVPQPNGINIPTSIVNPDCGVANGEATVNATGGNGGFTYSWNSTPVQTTATVTGLLAGVYTVTVTDMNGCTRDADVILVDNFAPNATIEDRVPDCGQGVGQATAFPTSGIAPYTYEWSTTPVQATATASGLLEGDYFVSITDGTGCVQIINVKIDSIPPPSVSVATTPADCGQNNGEALASTTDGIMPYVYTWSTSINTANSEIGLAAGNYTVTVTDSIGCTTTEPFEITQLEPESDIIYNNACDGEPIFFETETTSGATVWSWDFGDGNSSDQENATHIYAAPGQYDVQLTLEGGCMNQTVNQTVTVFDPPTAEFIINPEIVSTRTAANFIYTGNGGSSFSWSFGDGESSFENSPSHLYGEDGFYTVFMQTTDANGCEDTVSLTIEVLLQPVVYLPNAFMPEGTSENSRFKAYGIGITGAELSVFDRWGTLLYFSNDATEIINRGWDGTFKGKPAGQDAYAYKIKASFYNNSTFEKLGTVTLIR